MSAGLPIKMQPSNRHFGVSSSVAAASMCELTVRSQRPVLQDVFGPWQTNISQIHYGVDHIYNEL